MFYIFDTRFYIFIVYISQLLTVSLDDFTFVF